MFLHSILSSCIIPIFTEKKLSKIISCVVYKKKKNTNTNNYPFIVFIIQNILQFY